MTQIEAVLTVKHGAGSIYGLWLLCCLRFWVAYSHWWNNHSFFINRLILGTLGIKCDYTDGSSAYTRSHPLEIQSSRSTYSNVLWSGRKPENQKEIPEGKMWNWNLNWGHYMYYSAAHWRMIGYKSIRRANCVKRDRRMSPKQSVTWSLIAVGRCSKST